MRASDIIVVAPYNAQVNALRDALPWLTLLYPHHVRLSGPDGIQERFRITDQTTAFETASIDVAVGNGVQIVARFRKLLVPASEDAN